ncbi:MAG: DNA polymerase II large subunit [Candidatus Asgardarchaeia archaeon]
MLDNSQTQNIKQYFDRLKELVLDAYEIAKKARSKGLDPSYDVEIIPAADVAARVEGLLGPPGVSKRINELLAKKSREETAYQIAVEIATGKLGSLPMEDALDKALRVALAILTEGITAGPLEGIAQVKVKENNDGSKYLAVYYAGPIRAAGGTETAQTVVIADYIRKAVGLERYIPNQDEVDRYIEEIELYERRVTHLQYSASRDEIEFAVKHVPIEITGEPTDPIEVSGHRNLPRVETNRLRGGAILVLNDGIIGRAHKLLKIVRELNISGWDWLEDLVEMRKKKQPEENTRGESSNSVNPDYKYLSDVIAGRAVFSHPMTIGGFRLRYGKSRNTGLAAVGINPVTMYVLSEFLAPGTHIRTERPGKGAVVLPVTTIEGPTILLSDGSVVKLDTLDEYFKLKQKKQVNIEKILYLGDILVGFGEFLENNHILLPSPYVEEWWISEVSEKLKSYKKSNQELKESMKKLVERLIENPFNTISFEEAFSISKEFNVPLHPKYLFYWNAISVKDFLFLYDFLFTNKQYLTKSILPFDERIKHIFEKIGLPHKILRKKDSSKIFIQLNSNLAQMLFTIFSLSASKRNFDLDEVKSKNPLELLNILSPVLIKNKGSIFIGARMGRPEKAKPRKMSPPVHGLFPVGDYGGKSRDIIEAIKKKKITVEVRTRLCPKCKVLTPYNTCHVCGAETVNVYYCSKCNIVSPKNTCPKCGAPLKPYSKILLDLSDMLKRSEKMGISLPYNKRSKIKGVKGLSSGLKVPERLEKAILRSKYDLYVFKDGTIRFDGTDAPLTHITPEEIGVSVEKLKTLGYTEDIYGNPLTNEKQILELKVQDIVIPEVAADYLLNVTKFIDELLTKFYGLKPYYKCKTRDDLVGHLVIGLAPHTSAGIVGRIIGFTRAQVIFAHPFWHAAKRRNCDGDEDSIILLLDGFLNFSKYFLPSKRGGTMDAPLVLTVTLNPFEVDDESWNLDVMDRYPVEFYVLTQKYATPKDALKFVDVVEKRLGTPYQYFGFRFTHDTLRIDLGPPETIYKRLKTMKDKVDVQLSLAEKISAVDVHDVARRVLISHLLPDIIGSLRSFLTQTFRCLNCNAKYRRIPLRGVCLKCGGKLTLTVSKGSVTKYLDLAKKIIDRYALDSYLKERISMLEETIKALFAGSMDNEIQARISLEDFIT